MLADLGGQVGDEFIFITELSAKLAERYHRPLPSIAVNVQHSQCLFFAGTFEPAYTVTVSALAEYVQPTTNRRNAYILSEHLEEALGVTPPRGLFTFVPLPEENVAVNGKTIAQAVDDALESEGHGMGVIDEEKPTGTASRRKRLSVKVSTKLVQTTYSMLSRPHDTDQRKKQNGSLCRTFGPQQRWEARSHRLLVQTTCPSLMTSQPRWLGAGRVLSRACLEGPT